jgi:predicted phage gp36 major capsid-like protein
VYPQRLNGKLIPRISGITQRQEQFKREANETLEEVETELKSLRKDIQELKVSQKQKDALCWRIT